MSKSSAFLISDLISDHHGHHHHHHIFNHMNKKANPNSHHRLIMPASFHQSSVDYMTSRSDDLSNSRTSISSSFGDAPSVSSTSSLSSTSSTSVAANHSSPSSSSSSSNFYSQISEMINKNKTSLPSVLNNHYTSSNNNINSHLETALLHSVNNKFCNCMSCNAVRFFSYVNPNYNVTNVGPHLNSNGISNMNGGRHSLDINSNLNHKNLKQCLNDSMTQPKRRDLKQKRTTYLPGNGCNIFLLSV
jgi:hypothetical protein